MVDNKQRYWGTKLTVYWGKNKDYTGVIYTKEERFAQWLQTTLKIAGYRSTLEAFYKPEKR